MRILHTRFQPLITALLIAIIGGCQSPSNERIASKDTLPDIGFTSKPYLTVDRINKLASRSAPDNASVLYSQSIGLLLEMQDMDYLDRMLKTVDPALLDPVQLIDIEVMRAETALASNQLGLARSLLENINPANQTQTNRLLALSAQVFTYTRQYHLAAENLMQIVPDNGDEQALNDEIWKNCMLSTKQQVRSQEMNSENASGRAWWNLAKSVVSAKGLSEEKSQIQNWLMLNRFHTARSFPPIVLTELANYTIQGRTIALFLPLSGRLASAGIAIREGFVAAFYNARYLPKHKIRIYDTNTQSIQALYQQALMQQVDLIVGPLQKSNLSELAQLPYRTIPVLGLNTLAAVDQQLVTPGADVDEPTLVQFSLAIEDEAQSVAQKLIELSFRNVAIISSPNNWSERAVLELKKELSPNQKIVAEVELNDLKEITDEIGVALTVTDSIKRQENLQKTIKSLAIMTPRSRRDLDVVVALIDGQHASALVSALQYHFSADVPIYSVSQITQKLSEAQLEQLEKIQFTEIPWRMDNDVIQTQMRASFGASNRSVDPLHAFGADAFRITKRLELLLGNTAQILRGGTGTLSINSNRLIERKMNWAIIRRGRISYAS